MSENAKSIKRVKLKGTHNDESNSYESIKSNDQTSKHFENIDGKSQTFKNINFSYSIFSNCYFRDAKFINCTFVGCKIYDSNFKGSVFVSCSFDYSLFFETIIPSNEIIVNLPKEHNIRRELLQNLRANAVSQCEYEDEKKFILHEIKATKSYYRAAAKKEDSYYRNKYPGILNTLKFNMKTFALWLDGFTWGHGESIYKAIKFIILSWLTISLIASISNQTISLKEFIENAYYTLHLLLDATPPESLKIELGQILVLLIAALRFVALGLLITMLYRRVSHR